MSKPLTIAITGKWRSRHIRNGAVEYDSGVCTNQIQDQAFVTIASLLMNQYDPARLPAETLQVFGITHIEYGVGLSTWDSVPPSKPYSALSLASAVYRKPIEQTEISFVPAGDPFGGSAVSLTPTNRVRIMTRLDETEYTGPLREFGLFCAYDSQGDGLNEGKIFNWVSHPLINKDNSITIERVIEITIERGN